MRKTTENFICNYIVAPFGVLMIVALCVFLLATTYMMTRLAISGDFRGGPNQTPQQIEQKIEITDKEQE